MQSRSFGSLAKPFSWILLLIGLFITGQGVLPDKLIEGIAYQPAGAVGLYLKETGFALMGFHGTYLIALTAVLIGIVSVFEIVPTHTLSLQLNGLSNSRIKLPRIRLGLSTKKRINSTSEKGKPNKNYSKKVSSRLSLKRKLQQESLDFLFSKSNQFPDDKHDPQIFEQISQILLKALQDFNVRGKINGWHVGPMATVFEFQPDPGIKQSRVMGLIDDLALVLKVGSIFMHPLEGKAAIGIQVPNPKRKTVLLGDLLSSDQWQELRQPLSFAMGLSIEGDVRIEDIATMPHVLIAGATGSGKSVGINTLLCSILSRSTPEQVRLILVDPKQLELAVYEGVPHLLLPVITDCDKAASALRWAINEMEIRYKLMRSAGVRNIEGFNEFWNQLSEADKPTWCEKWEKVQFPLPYILVVIDELADLMLTAGKEIETTIQRLAQKARASGIHLVLATQRPSVDVVTGVIKANFPCRIAYQVVSKHDSRTILDQVGAEKLLGKGDLLYQKPGNMRLERLQGAFITDQEVTNFVKGFSLEAQPNYVSSAIEWIENDTISNMPGTDDCDEEEEDIKYYDATLIAKTQGSISASYIQRQLKIGYNRAARIVELMEKRGLVGPQDGSKAREWLGPI